MGDYNNTEQGMFAYCKSLISLDLSSFDTRNVTNMKYMFENCSALESIVFGNNFDTSKVTTMYWMFRRCTKITSIAFGNNFNTAKVTNMASMFSACTSLTSLDLSSFTLKEGVDISGLFYGDSNMKSIDIRNCEFNNVTTSWDTFYYLVNNCNIIVKSDTERDFILSKKSTFTNIQTVAELQEA